MYIYELYIIVKKSSLFQIQTIVHVDRREEMVRQCSATFHWTELHYSGNGETEHSTGQHRAHVSPERKLHLHCRLCARNDGQGNRRTDSAPKSHVKRT